MILRLLLSFNMLIKFLEVLRCLIWLLVRCLIDSLSCLIVMGLRRILNWSICSFEKFFNCLVESCRGLLLVLWVLGRLMFICLMNFYFILIFDSVWLLFEWFVVWLMLLIMLLLLSMIWLFWIIFLILFVCFMVFLVFMVLLLCFILFEKVLIFFLMVWFLLKIFDFEMNFLFLKFWRLLMSYKYLRFDDINILVWLRFLVILSFMLMRENILILRFWLCLVRMVWVR